jgi:hypothetical protein
MIASILDGLTYIFSIVTLALTVRTAILYRKPKKFNLSSILSSIALSLITLVVFILVSGANLNLVIGIVLFMIGGIWGVIRGATIKMYPLEGDLIVQNSVLSLVGWGGSIALSSFMNSFDSALLAALGLIPLCMSTGTSVAIKITVLFRRLLIGKIG